MKHTSKQIVFADALTTEMQYTVVATVGNKVITRARTHDGAPVYVEQQYCPTYYIPVASAEAKNATHQGFDGTPLIPHMVDSIWEAKAWIESRKAGVYGDIPCEYMVLADAYGSSDLIYNLDNLYIWNIDIETDSEGGFATPEDPFQPVTAITVKWRHMGKKGVVVYGTKDYKVKGDEFYVQCKTEEELLLKFLDDFRAAGDYPDIVTGWNIQFYDMPYLVERMKKLFTEEIWIRMSPLNRLATRTVILLGRSEQVVDVKGIAILDYIELYRKFTYSQQESYKLDNIAHVELGRRKVSFKEVGSLRRLYREDHQKFIEYNINDVELVDELDQKLKLIELVCALAYGAKCNLADCFKQVRLWDVMIYHKLRADKKQIPPRPPVHRSDDQYEGAHVKDPIVGLHNWIASFDVASMYPHIIREWNLSPECKFPDRVTGLTVNDLLDGTVDTSDIKQRDMCMAANGVLTDRHREGFIPEMLKSLYDERIRYKKLQEKADIDADATTDPDAKKEFKRLARAYENQQKVRKVNLNSAYGALGSCYFRYYDRDLAEAVTITGQYIIRLVAKNINDQMNQWLKTNHDYIIASDTDSVYVQMEKIVQQMPVGATTAQIVKGLHNFCEKKIQPIINGTFDQIADYLNVHTSCMSMVRDVIADKAVWTAKKRYIINMWVSEGKWFKEPKLLVHGLESIKSSTPEIVRDMIKKAFTLMMTGTQEQVWKHIIDSEEKFRAGGFEDIAFPRSVNGLDKYADKLKGLPIQVAGALAFNRHIDRTGLATTYEKVRDGEKIKFAYLKQPNPFFSHVMAAPQGCPAEWEIEKWLDYDKQFESTFLAPIRVILLCMGWTPKYEAALW